MHSMSSDQESRLYGPSMHMYVLQQHPVYSSRTIHHSEYLSDNQRERERAVRTELKCCFPSWPTVIKYIQSGWKRAFVMMMLRCITKLRVFFQSLLFFKASYITSFVLGHVLDGSIASHWNAKNLSSIQWWRNEAVLSCIHRQLMNNVATNACECWVFYVSTSAAYLIYIIVYLIGYPRNRNELRQRKLKAHCLTYPLIFCYSWGGLRDDSPTGTFSNDHTPTKPLRINA